MRHASQKTDRLQISSFNEKSTELIGYTHEKRTRVNRLSAQTVLQTNQAKDLQEDHGSIWFDLLKGMSDTVA